MSYLSDYFERLLPVVEKDLHQILQSTPSAPPLYYQMMHYHMGWIDEEGREIDRAGGKRIRPMLALLVSEAVSGSFEPARPAAAAVELIHNFSLLHDDIQDGSPLRHRRPTAWTIWGTSQGINAGDAMFALAHLAIPRLAGDRLDSAVLIQMLRVLDETCIELTRGQHLDMSFETRDEVSVAEYLDMIAGKTAALIAAAAHMAALGAGASKEAQGHYQAFGHNLGLAFQVLDDVLDIWGEPAKTGKEAAVDIRQRKKSLPVLYGIQQSKELRALYMDSDPMTEQKVQNAIRLLDSVNAREYAESLAREYSANTLSHLEAAKPQGNAGKALFELIDYLLQRSF